MTMRQGSCAAITVNLNTCFSEGQRITVCFGRGQFTDEHGEVCPANWRPGGATIKPDPKGSKTYFANQKN